MVSLKMKQWVETHSEHSDYTNSEGPSQEKVDNPEYTDSIK